MGHLPEGYEVPDYDITFTADTEGNIEITSDNATVEVTDSMTYIVVTLKVDEGGEEDDDDPAKIAGASVILGTDLKMKYHVDIIDEELLEGIDQISMRFTRNGKMATVGGVYNETTGYYVFSFENIPPQCMGDNIKAELLFGETVIAEKAEYSVKQNLSNILENNSDDVDLVQLITDILTYGAAAQNYKDYNTESLANADVENLGTPSTALPKKSDKSVTASLSDTVYFTAATVRFDNVNKIGIKLSTTENARLFINSDEITLGDELYYYTDAIYATEFDKVFKFTLHDGKTLVQTLTYSVSSYVYSMQSSENAEMVALANALYNYGMSAKRYAHMLNCDGEYIYTHTDNGDGTHNRICSICGYVETENETHTFDDTDGECQF